MSPNPNICTGGILIRKYFCRNCNQLQVQHLQGAGTMRRQKKKDFCNAECKKEYRIKKSDERRTKLPFEP